ncbi:AAA family ATPase [Empedobacter brevis]|uniref:AAA family ATPase n=1 Tax=Empedobacter brevis TaxID=247 RepID=UPI0028975C93|nr:DUF3696 domain-containing protein [Empedobacter brevis]
MLSNILIENFKVLRKVDLNLNNLNLISGKNSAGKSTLIQALLVIRQSFEKLTLLDRGLLLQGDYTNLGKGRDVFTYYSDEDFFKFVLNFNDEFTLNLKYEYEQSRDIQKVFKNSINEITYKSLEDRSLFNSHFRYLSANRISPQDYYKKSDFHVITLNTLGIEGEYTAHYLSENENMEVEFVNLIHPSDSNKSLISQVNAWLNEFSNNIRVSSKIQEDVNSAIISYDYLKGDSYKENISPKNVGFGLTYVLPVITLLLSSKPGDLIIIENPEAHLHPAAQSKIGELISLTAENDVQIIIETHSDHILNGIRSSVVKKYIDSDRVNCYYFDNNEKSNDPIIDLLNIDNRGTIDNWPNGFFDEWDKQLDIILDL